METSVDIAELSGETLAIVRTEKWYADLSTLEFEGKSFALRLENQPLATWTLKLNGEQLMSYGLEAKSGHIGVRINDNEMINSHIPHFLLWYLFSPIAIESMGTDLLFNEGDLAYNAA